MPHKAVYFPGGILVAGLLAFVTLWFVSGVIFYLALRWAGIRASIPKAMLAILAGILLAYFVARALLLVPLIGILASPLGYVIAFMWVIKEMFETTWGKALLSLILVFVIQILIMAVFAILIGISAYSFLTTCPFPA